VPGVGQDHPADPGDLRNAPPPPARETLRQLYVVEGLSVAEVALRLGLSRGRVTAALDAAGIVRQRPGWIDSAPPDPISRGSLIRLYVEDGMTVRQVAAALGTTTTRVNAALRRHGIPRRPEPQSPPPPRVGQNHAVLHQWYVIEGRTLEQIARQQHTTKDTVRTWLQTAGVSVQPRTAGKTANVWIRCCCGTCT